MKKLLILLLATLLTISTVVGGIACNTNDNGDTGNGDNNNGGNGSDSTDTTAPVISGITVSDITETSVTITWATNELATSNIEYGTTSSYGSSIPSTSDTMADKTNHNLNLSGLSAGTTYHFCVKSKDSANNEAISEDKTFTTTSQTKDFELIEWETVCDNSSPSLLIKFTATEHVDLFLNDPDGLEVGWDYDAATETKLDMADFEETPKAGEYRLIVQDFWGDTIDTYSFDFQGADVVISDVVTTWEYWSYFGTYSLDTISFKVTNNGDLPMYINDGLLTIGGENDDFYISNGCILPGEYQTFTPWAYISDVTSGQQSLTLELKDGAGTVVCSYSSTETPSA